MSRDETQRLFQEAERKTSAREWEPAGERWAQLARLLESREERERAIGAWGAAGDASFRADRPFEAIRCLERSLDLLEMESSAHPESHSTSILIAVRLVQLAGVLMETGSLRRAECLLSRVDEMPVGPGVAALQRDTRIGLFLLLGRTEEARRELALLSEQAPAGASPLLHYRAGQINRFEGSFQEAYEHLLQVVEEMNGRPEMDGPLGATFLEQVELALAQGNEALCLPILEQAERAWSRAGRRSGVLRVEASRLRVAARLTRGQVITARLDPGVIFAQERGLVFLEAELRLCRAECRLWRSGESPYEDLAQVIALAESAGARPISGQARLLMHDHPQGDLLALVQASRELGGAVSWLARAVLARARLLVARGERERARTILLEARDRCAGHELPELVMIKEMLDRTSP